MNRFRPPRGYPVGSLQRGNESGGPAETQIAPAEGVFDVVEPKDDSSLPRTVAKALLVLDAFRVCGHTVGVSRLSDHTGLAKSTVHRLLTELVEAGYVVRSGSAYRLSVRAFELGSSYIHGTPKGLVQIVSPHLGSLFLHTQCDVGLYVLDQDDVVLLAGIESGRFPLQSPSRVAGSRTPALTTAAGKAIAAFLPAEEAQRLVHVRPQVTRFAPPPETVAKQLEEAHESGFAVDVQEHEVGLISVASPILVGDVPVAAVSASAPVGRLDLPTVRAAVLRTSRIGAQAFIAVRRDLQDYGPASPHHDLLNEDAEAARTGPRGA